MDILPKIKKHHCLFAFVLNVVLLLSCCLCFRPIYLVNDDQLIVMIAEGAFGKPSDYLVYPAFWVGKLLENLYSVIPQISWAVLLLYAIMFLGWWGITAVILKRSNSALQYPFLLGFLCVFAGYGYRYLQYSQVAMVASAAGFLLLADQLETEKEKRKTVTFCDVAGIILLVLGGGIRKDCLLALAPLFALYYVIRYLVTWHRCGIHCLNLWPGWMAAGAVFLSLSLVWYGNYLVKQDPEWSEYIRFNQLRTEIHDYGRMVLSDSPQEQLDQNLLFEGGGLNCFFADTNVYTSDTLESWITNSPVTFQGVMSGIMTGLRQVCQNKAAWLTVAFLIAFALVTRGRLWTLLFVGYYIADCFMISVLFGGRYRSYVVWGICLGIMSLGLMLWKSDQLSDILRKVIRGGSIAATCVIGIACVLLLKDGVEEKRGGLESQAEQTNSVTQDLYQITNQKENFYLCELRAFLRSTWDYENLYVRLNRYLPEGQLDNCILTGGWETNSKRTKEICRAYQIENPVQALIEKDNAFLISDKSVEDLEYLVNFLQRHYDYEGEPVLVEQTEYLYVYQF